MSCIVSLYSTEEIDLVSTSFTVFLKFSYFLVFFVSQLHVISLVISPSYL